ncbi:MAG: methyltransferase [Acidimicrobiia bacterium]|nr:methyltransferase [Acidimicrobiia bacterium]
MTLTTDAGVFSPERIDPATKLLLQEATDLGPTAAEHTDPHLLDLGCGYGPIALTLARRFPTATVWAIDTNERAVALCRANARAHGLDHVRPCVSTDDEPFAGVPDDIRFAGIWSNPPVRIGKAAMTALVSTALDRLTATGLAHLVVHRHLGADSLHRSLEGAGWQVTRRLSRRGIRLLEVSRRDDRDLPAPDAHPEQP